MKISPMSIIERQAAGWRRHPQLVLLAALVLAAGTSIFLGRFPAPGLAAPLRLLEDPLAQRLILNLRLPRILIAILLGAALSGAGAAMQMLFRNPLVEPDIMGLADIDLTHTSRTFVVWHGRSTRMLKNR